MSSAIVLDNGSGSIKAGFADSEQPMCVFQSVLGRPRSSNSTFAKPQAHKTQPKLPNDNDDNQNNSNRVNDNNTHVVFGGAALRKRGLLSLRYPIEHGIVVNWDDMEKLWSHSLFDQLRVDPSQHPLLLTEASLNPRANREKSAQIMFETFNVAALCIGVQSTLGLYSTGRSTGVVIESGEGVTHACPIYEGYSLPQAILRLDLGGRDVTDYLVKLLSTQQRMDFLTAAEREVVRAMKEDVCFVATNFEKEVKRLDMNDKSNVVYELPDGNQIKLGSIRCKAPEILFQPSIVGNEQFGITDLVHESISKCEIDIRRTFFQNIVLIGGNTMFDGIHARLHKSLNAKTPNNVRIKICADSNRKYCVWTGASILSHLSLFRQNWMTQQQYQEHGADRIHESIV